MLVDGVNEKETKEIIENKKEAEKQSTAIFNADKERDKKKMLCFCFGTTYLEVLKCF